MDEENAACESGCMPVSQPSHLSIAIETGEQGGAGAAGRCGAELAERE